MASATLTIRISQEVKDQLGRLATSTQRTSSFLAGEAIAAYVAREVEIVEGIRAGLDDMASGKIVTHDEAMARIETTIASAERDGA